MKIKNFGFHDSVAFLTAKRPAISPNPFDSLPVAYFQTVQRFRKTVKAF
jgi:hypothetical protein